MPKGRDRKLAEKRRKRKQRLEERASTQRSVRRLRQDEQDIKKEVEYIIKCAEKRECHVVGFGELVLFCAPNGDAWILDSDDQFALCLMDRFERMDVNIDSSDPPSSRFVIEWNADYEIDDDTFVARYRDGRTESIVGYPTALILDTIESYRKHGRETEA